MFELRIGPRFRKILPNPESEFWRVAANYDVVPVAFQSLDGTYRACNRSFENMVGMEATAVRGSEPKHLFDERTAALLEQTFKTAIAQRSPAQCAFWQRFRHGACLYVECRMFPIGDEHELVGVISDFLDVTHLLLAAESLKTSLSILRHDLSSPMLSMGVILQEMRTVSKDTVSAALRTEIVELLNVCLALIRVWSRVGHSEQWMQRFSVEPVIWDHFAALWRQKMAQRLESPAQLEMSVAVKEPFWWSPDNLMALFTRIPEICCSTNKNAKIQAWNFSVAPCEKGVTCQLRFECSEWSEKEVNVSLFGDTAVLNALARGAEVTHVLQDRECRLVVELPNLQVGRWDKCANELGGALIKDYEGVEFLRPDSLYCALFDMTGIRVGIFSDDGILQACSYWLAEALGSRSQDLIGKHYSEFFAPHVTRWLNHDFQECLRNDSRKAAVVSRVVPLCVNGVAAYYEVFMSNAAEGGRTLVISHVRDRVQTRRLLQTVVDKGAGYLSGLLTRIGNQLNLLAARVEDLAPEEACDVRLMMEETNHMMSVLGHWQRLFEIERGTYQLQPRPVDLRKVIRVVLFEQHIDGSVLQEDPAEPPDPFVVPGDEALLHLLFQNLINNAQRAAQEEQGTLSIRLRREGDHVTVAIRNAGETPAIIRPIFFEKFVKGPRSEGMGLGTYSAKLVANLHRGRIELDASEPGYTTICVQLPAL
jgi:PAS domain S-box-containing protein